MKAAIVLQNGLPRRNHLVSNLNRRPVTLGHIYILSLLC